MSFCPLKRFRLHVFFIHLQADNETSHPWTRGSEACSGGYEFSSIERRFNHFSSIYKLVIERFNHSKECYNMLSRLQVFIHAEEGHTFFHPSTSWLRIFSTTDKRVTTCSRGYEFSFIEQWVTHFFIHLQAGYGTFQPKTRGLQHALEVKSFHPLRGGLHIFFIHVQADYVTFHPQKRGLRRHSETTVHSLWQGDLVQNCSNTLHNVLHDSAKKVCQDANNRTLYSRKAAIPHLERLSSSGNSSKYYVPPFSSLIRCIPKRSKLLLKSKENNDMTCREWKAGIAMQHCNEEEEEDIAVRTIWLV